MIRMIVAVFVLSLGLFAYPVWRLGEWLHLSVSVNLMVTVPFFLSQFIARLLLRHRTGKLAYFIRGAADFFLGLSPVLLLLVLLGELLTGWFNWPGGPVAIAIMLITALFGLWGLWRAWRPDIVVVPLRSAKLARPVRFAQISDVHIGSRTARFLRQVIEQVNAEHPAFLCITGDFIDQPGVGIDKLKALQSFHGPIYYSIGNHERYEDLEQIVERMASLGVEVLRNRALEVDGFQFIGIDDHDHPGQVGRVLPFIDVKRDHYSILLYHRPHGLEAAHSHGIDLKLSGHTHAGQIVPFHLAVNKVFEYTSGLYHLGGTNLYVNEGTGTWGPTLRLGTRSEITIFDLQPG